MAGGARIALAGERMELNSVLLKSSFVGALGGLLFGFDTAVISGTQSSLTAQFSLSAHELAVTVSIALVGTVIGAMSAGEPGQRFGPRDTLRVLAMFYVVSALGCAFAMNLPMLLVFRFLVGLAVGGSSVLSPVYIAEIAPAEWRGRLVGSFQISVVLGILVAYLSNYFIGTLGLGLADWRWMFGVAAVPALLFFMLLFGIPNSPRWLATKGRNEEARRVLNEIGASDPEGEMRDIERSIHLEKQGAGESLFTAKYRFPIFLAISIGIFNQLSGINAILYYLNPIFAAAGYSRVSSDLQTVAIGAVNLFATLVGMTLIDKLGRKTLLLIGSVGTALSLAGVAMVFFTRAHQERLLWFLVTYIAFFAISQGAVIWVYIGEVFPNAVRAKGQSLGSSAHWITNAIISFTFPLLAAKSGAYPFVFFAVMMVVQLVVVGMFYPETKGVSLEQLQAKLGIE
jgi:SP family arabinose:H+ symporter-like MFS transporter